MSTLYDTDIDTSDIPEVRDWSRAITGRFYRATKVDSVKRKKKLISALAWSVTHEWKEARVEAIGD